MGVDLHRIGFGISSGTSRTGFGTIVSFPSGGGGCPAAGSFNSNTALIEYSIANGGDFFSITLFGGTSSTDVPNENAQFQIKNDGSCGTYTDYSTAFNVGYKSNGVIFDTDLSASTGYSQLELPYPGSGTYYPIGDNYSTRVHDGGGSWSASSTTVYFPYNTVIATFDNQIEVPSSSGTYYDTGTSAQYKSDGVGGYYTATVGSLLPAGEFIYENVTSTNTISMPSGSSPVGTYNGERYTWDGSGGYSTVYTWYVPYGTYIEDYDYSNYYHDGAGSYYSVPI